MARNQDRQYHLSANRTRKSKLQQLIERDELIDATMDIRDCDEQAASDYVDWLISQHESESGYENQITEATLAGMGVWA